MYTKFIKGLSQVESKYDAFFIDLWGVVHNGVELYSGAVEVLKNLHKLQKRFVLISNAPRPSKNVEKYLSKLNLDKAFIKNIYTSGEAAIKILRENIYGKNFYHLGPERDKDLFNEFKDGKASLEKCDFILCTGLFENNENSLNYYKNLLKNCKKLKMVCTNPDLIVHRGSRTEYCAGSLAAMFEELGGEVIYIGKPYPEIYNHCIKKDEKVLAIGDNIRTDIVGANKMSFDSLFITQGVHENEFKNLSHDDYDKVLKKYNAQTNYYQERLTW